MIKQLNRRELGISQFLTKLPSYIMMTQQKNQNPNGVKGNAISSSRTSLGGRFSTQQGTFDRHPATACNTREKLKIVTWNVRTMYQAGKLVNIVLETKRMGIDIMGLAEVRWLQSGKIVCNDHTLIYSGHKKYHKHGVGLLLSKVVSKTVLGYCALSDRILLVRIHGKPFNLSIIQVYAPTSASSEEEIEDFYSDLEDSYNKCGNQDIVIAMDDLNAKVGGEQDPLQKLLENMYSEKGMIVGTCG